MIVVKNVTIDRDTVIRGTTKLNLVDLSYYAQKNIPNYNTITKIPKENMDYINSVKYANNCNSMFNNCKSLTSLDLANFDTGNVTNMRYMFRECNTLSSLNISNFDTSNVTNMYTMFFGCESLTSLDLSNFDTSIVTDMGNMFYYCITLSSLNISNFNTSKVTNMEYMFDYCWELSTLDLSHFNTSKVTDMGGMFRNCKKLTTVKGTLDLSSCTDIYTMFDNTPNLRGVHLKNVPRRLVDTDGSLKDAGGTLNKTYIIDNIL